MKYCVLIIDGAAGRPLAAHGGMTTLELARTPNLDGMTPEGRLGMGRTVPSGMEPSSAVACMSLLGYDPRVYYGGRAAIEAKSMGVPVAPEEVVFRCNLVTIKDGRMRDYSAGHINTEEASQLIEALNGGLSDLGVSFHTGLSYRHLMKIRGRKDTLKAICTPPHDIPDREIAGFLPRGEGSDILCELMRRSQEILGAHPVNQAREARCEAPASSIWLCWGTGEVPRMPSFSSHHGLAAALTSGVDLLRGLGMMMDVDILEIPGVTDGPDNDYAAQAKGALAALAAHDMVIIHVEAPDEAGHTGSVEGKIAAIEAVDREIVGRITTKGQENLRVLAMPDHPTPIEIRTHSADPVPFLMWGNGIEPDRMTRFTEPEAAKTGLLIDDGYTIMTRLIKE